MGGEWSWIGSLLSSGSHRSWSILCWALRSLSLDPSVSEPSRLLVESLIFSARLSKAVGP